MRSSRLVSMASTIAFSLALVWLSGANAYAEKIPALTEVPPGISNETRSRLTQRRQELNKEYHRFKNAADAFSAKPAEQQSDEEYNSLQAWRTRYIETAKAFNEEVANASRAPGVAADQSASAPEPAVDLLGPKGRRVVKAMNDLARKLGWSPEEQDRLDKALHSLGVDPATWSDNRQIQRIWKDVFARGQDPLLLQEASQGGGLGFPGAGKQSNAQDCAVFALANAAGLPYEVVAGRAAELIRQGEWRSADERANPQRTIERGLIGGEVVMLAEAFGRAEVVAPSDFARTLTEGRPVMVCVVPKGGDLGSGHEVVLTKTFQHDGETWYVMMDSYLDPEQRRFLSARELNTMLTENGVAFRPEPDTTPQLLRGEEAPR